MPKSKQRNRETREKHYKYLPAILKETRSGKQIEYYAENPKLARGYSYYTPRMFLYFHLQKRTVILIAYSPVAKC